MYASIAAIRKANKAIGHHWFDADAMRFFNTEIEAGGRVFQGHYFVTSDRMERTDPKRYTLRYADDEGKVTTVGDLAQHATVTHARHAIPS